MLRTSARVKRQATIAGPDNGFETDVFRFGVSRM